MTWNTDFYTAVTTDSNFAANVTSLAHEYWADAVVPFATYQLISAVGTNDLSGTGDEGSRRIQLNVTASSLTQAILYAGYATAGIRASSLALESKSERTLGHDDQDNTFTHAIDYIIWFDAP